VNDLKDIGAFTRENLEHWLFEGRNMRPSYSDFLNMMAAIKHIHAVCGDVEIIMDRQPPSAATWKALLTPKSNVGEGKG
jgi:hypothetical protein